MTVKGCDVLPARETRNTAGAPPRLSVADVVATTLTVDKDDHLWVFNRSRGMRPDENGASTNPPRTDCCVAGPSILEFDIDGNLLRSWGGPGYVPGWPTSEQTVATDGDGNVWVSGTGRGDSLLKFTPDGKSRQFSTQSNASGAYSFSTLITGLDGKVRAVPRSGTAGEATITYPSGNTIKDITVTAQTAYRLPVQLFMPGSGTPESLALNAGAMASIESSSSREGDLAPISGSASTPRSRRSSSKRLRPQGSPTRPSPSASS